MRKACWFTLVFTLGLLGALVAIPGEGLAGPVSTKGGPADTRSAILDPFINIWEDGVDNLTPAVAYNSRHDEYLVVWYNQQGPATWDIYARRVGGDGTLLSWFAVASDAGYRNWQPDVAYSPEQDEYLVVYTYEPAPDDYDIWARRISWNGDWMGPELPINTDVDKQWNPTVAYSSQNDEYLVVYENWWGGGLRDIAAQRVRASDGQLLSWRNIATGAGEERVFPDVAYNGARNEYLIIYTFDVGSDGHIYGKVASANMGTLSSEIHICDDAYDQDFPSVAAGPDEYLVAWEDGIWGTDDYDIYGRRVSGDGVPQGPAGGFSVAAETANLHVDPAVAYGLGYGYLVTWRYFDPGSSGQDVYGRYVMPGRNQAAGAAFEIDSGSDLQAYPALACDFAADCLVVEEDNWPGGDYEIRGRFVRPHHVYLPLTLRKQ